MTVPCLSLGTGDDGLGVVLSGAEAVPVVGRLDLEPEDLEDCEPAFPTGLLTPDLDPRCAAEEHRAAEALAALLGGPELEEIRLALARHEGAHEQPVIALDLRRPDLAELSWELLEDLPPGMGPLAGWRVFRQGAGGRELRVGSGLRILRWCPGQGEGPPAPSPDGTAQILHLVCHGVASLESLSLALADGQLASPGAVAAHLRQALARTELVLLEVCSGGASLPLGLAGRLLAWGAPAVIGPQRPIGKDAAETFRVPVLEALAAGETVLEAVARGRTALRRLAVAHPSARWWQPVAHTGDREGLANRPLCRTGPAWQGAGPEVAGLLAVAWERATAEGWCGVRHLLLAVAGSDPLGADLARVAKAGPLSGGVDATRPPLSPRLRVLLAAPAPPDRAGLTRLLVGVPWVAARLDPGVLASLQSPEDRWSTAPARPGPRPALGGAGLVLEVWGGPEDGRQVRLDAPGQTLGRWAPGSQEATALCLPPAPADRTLSRRHLVYEGGRTVRALATARLRRGSDEWPLDTVSLAVGDRVVLGQTVLEAR